MAILNLHRSRNAISLLGAILILALIGTGHAAAEQRLRAVNIGQAPSHEQQVQWRQQWQAAWRNEDWKAAIAPLRGLTLSSTARSEEWFSLGAAYEKLDRPLEALEAYRGGIAVLRPAMTQPAEQLIQEVEQEAGPEQSREWIGPAGPAFRFTLDGEMRTGRFSDRAHAVEWLAGRIAPLRPRWIELHVRAGRLARTAADDPQISIDLLRDVLGEETGLDAPLEQVVDYLRRHYRDEAHPLVPAEDQQPTAWRHEMRLRADALDELARSQHHLGEARQAVASSAKAAAIRHIVFGNGSDIDVRLMWRLLQALPEDAVLPPTPGLVMLTPESPNWEVELDAPASQWQAQYWFYSNTHKFWVYKFAAPPGFALDQVTVHAEFEHHPRAGHWAGVEAGPETLDGELLESIRLAGSHDRADAVHTRSAELAVPEDAPLVHMRVDHPRAGKYRVRRVHVEATFRRLAEVQADVDDQLAAETVEAVLKDMIEVHEQRRDRIRRMFEAAAASSQELQDAELGLIEAHLRLAEASDDWPRSVELAEQVVQVYHARLHKARQMHHQGMARQSAVEDAQLELLEARLRLRQLEARLPQAPRPEARRQEAAPPLEFRIAPTPETMDALSQMMGRLEPEVQPDAKEIIDLYGRFLAKEGPEAVRRHAGPFAWFVLREGVEIENPDLITAEYQGRTYLLLAHREPLIMQPRRDGEMLWRLEEVARTVDSRGLPAVRFKLDEAGGESMRRLTSDNLRRPMAILVGQEVITVPTLINPLGEAGLITLGRQPAQEEARQIVKQLRPLIQASGRDTAPAARQAPGTTVEPDAPDEDARDAMSNNPPLLEHKANAGHEREGIP